MAAIQMVTGVIASLANMLRIRGGPQHLPASWPLMIFMVSVFLVQNLITGQQLHDESAAAKSLLAMVLQVVVLMGLLYWRQHPERFVQTLTALTGVNIFFTAINWILLAQIDPVKDQTLLFLTWFAVFIWSLFVDAHIYRNALSVPLRIGMLITVLALAASYTLIEMIFLV